MSPLRAFLLHHRSMALMLVLVALCMKVLVPAGHMVGQGTKTLSIEFCSEAPTGSAARQIAIPMKEDADRSSGKHDQAQGDCAFSVLSMASLGGTPPALLADALVLILVTGLAAPMAPALQSTFDLRPPLRGPPAAILTI